MSEHSRVHPDHGRIWHARRKPNQQVTSPRGRAFLMREEGVIPYAYNDPVGFATFGVGHLIARRPVNALDRLRYGTKDRPKPKKAVKVFVRDLEAFEAAVRKAAGRVLPQHKFDALVSLAFNIGAGGFLTSTVARRVHARQPKVGEAILMWDNPSILRPRREREVELYQHGRYA